MFWTLIHEKVNLNYTANKNNETAILNNYFENIYFFPNDESIYSLVLIPTICLFGAFTNTLNIIIFLNKKMKDNSFKFMLAISIGNLLYTGMSSYAFFIYCDDCLWNKSYATQVFKILINNYVSSVLAVFVNISEIYLSISRYFVLTNKRYFQNISVYKVLILLTTFALVYNIPVLFCYDIKSKEYNSINKNEDFQDLITKHTTYSTKLSKFGKSTIGKYITIILIIIRILLSSIVLSAINIVNVYLFRLRFNKRLNSKLQITKSNNYIIQFENMIMKKFLFIALIQKSDFLVSTSHSIINNNKISTDPEQTEVTIPQNVVNLNTNKKASLKNHELKANRNMTLMVICTSALYSIYF